MNHYEYKESITNFKIHKKRKNYGQIGLASL